MKILEYDDVNPLEVLSLNLAGLGFALTPERAALIRKLDPRPFPFFAVYAQLEGTVAGQVGVFRMPIITTHGPDEVGGVWAVNALPEFSQRGIATQLMEEAHARMRSAGLRFSTLGTTRYRTAHLLYRKLGYEDLFQATNTLIRHADIPKDSHLHAEQADEQGLTLADELFKQAAAGYLGFSRRHKSFLPMMVTIGDVGEDDVWLLQRDDELAGYALASRSEAVLTVYNLLLKDFSDSAAAVSALSNQVNFPYIQVTIHHPAIQTSLRQAGFPPARLGWGTFMVKPLTPDATVEDARRLMGIGSDRFLISPIDLT